MKLTRIDGGSCWAPRPLLQPGEKWEIIEVPVHGFLIEHPRAGRLLLDTGYAKRIYTSAPLYAHALRVRPAPNIVPKIDSIILSHFHPDHVAGLRDYPEVPIRYPARALQACRQRPLRSGYLRSLLPDDFDSRSQPLANPARLPDWLHPFEEGWDVLGDESLWAIELPGHARGQIGLAGGSDKGRFFWVADACFTLWEVRQQKTPWPLLLWLAGADQAAYRQTLARLGQLSKEILLLPCHCPEVLKLLDARPSSDPGY